MKNRIISACSLVLGAIMLVPAAFAANIKTLEGINNKTAYVIKRQGQSGMVYGSLYYSEDTDICQASNSGVSATSPEAQWSIHYSESEKGYFLYNLGAGKFLSGNSKSQAVFTDEAVMVNPILLTSVNYWVLDCGGYIIGLEKSDKGAVIFADDVTTSNCKDVGYCFIIADTPKRELTDEEQQLIEDKISAGRTAAIQRYIDFVANGDKMLEKESEQMYAGAYPLDELKSMLADPDKYSLSQFEEAYNRAVIGRLPHEGGYYRLRNQNRPATYSNNLLKVKDDGQLLSVKLKTPVFGSAATGYVDDLSIFSVISDGGDPWSVRLYADAPGWYVSCSSNENSKAYAKPDASEATVFSFDPISDTRRPFRLRFVNSDNTYLTISGNNELVSYSTLETSMQFWFEEVRSIKVTTDANGYLSLILPVNVEIPRELDAWVLTSVADGKANFEDATLGVAAKTPFLIKGEPSTEYDLPTTDVAVDYPTPMTGTCVKAEVGTRQQIVSTAEDPKFEVCEEGPVNPGTAYLFTDTATPLEVVLGEIAERPEVGIEEINAEGGLDLFDLQGRLVRGTPRPGLYINAATRQVVRVK